MDKNRLESTLRGIALNKRFTRIATFCFFILTVITLWHRYSQPTHNFYPSSTISYFEPVNIPDADSRTTAELCASFPKHLTDTIQPVLKMGHSVSRSRVEAHFDSVSACFSKEELLIFSDLDETIKGRRVVDVLADLPPSYQVDNPDFINYIWQREMRENRTLDRDQAATAKINGWAMDKFKFLPMIERAWKERPDKAFYVFYETDTYISWDNMFRFLLSFDPDELHYMGSPSPGRHDDKANKKTMFANGGPGFILSRGAMKRLLRLDIEPAFRPEVSLVEEWLPLLRVDCCGDSVLGWIFWNLNVPLQGYWPLFNPNPVHGVPFNDDYWCQPILTLHKTESGDMRKLWKWEFGQRQTDRPLLYSDLWRFQHPGQPEVKRPWDNGDYDGWVAPAELGIETFERCGEYCLQHPECNQWMFRGGNENKCVPMRSIRYGNARTRDDERKGIEVSSGWVEERIEAWRRKKFCRKPEWVEPSLDRIY